MCAQGQCCCKVLVSVCTATVSLQGLCLHVHKCSIISERVCACTHQCMAAGCAHTNAVPVQSLCTAHCSACSHPHLRATSACAGSRALWQSTYPDTAAMAADGPSPGCPPSAAPCGCTPAARLRSPKVTLRCCRAAVLPHLLSPPACPPGPAATPWGFALSWVLLGQRGKVRVPLLWEAACWHPSLTTGVGHVLAFPPTP